MLFLYTFAFLYVKVDGLNNIYYLLMNIADKPRELFGKELLYGFMFIIPTNPLADIPSSVLLGKNDTAGMLLSLGTAVIVYLLSAFSMRVGLKRYTGASS